MGTVFRMGRIILLVISTALAAPQGNFSDNSDITMDEVILERSAISDRAINTCGCAPVSSTNRIVGGKEVSPKGKLPYQVMFYPCTPEGMCGLCGGTIIVNKKTMDNDIAVLELSEELTFTDKIKPACLPSSASKDFSGTASTISGWGGTIGYGPRDPRPKQPQQCGLKETMVKVLAGSDSKCSGVLGPSSSTIKLCAWSKDTDTCQGDSGGPLTVPENGKYTLVGVVSYGWGCASSTPGIYARVQGFLPWIKNLISSGECSGSSSSGGATTSSSGGATTASSGGATTGKPTTAKAT